MQKFIKFLFNFAATINYVAHKLQEVMYTTEYYVYVPTRGKPTYKHRTYKSAETEALRIAKQCKDNESIEILQIIGHTYGAIDDIPF